jgi:hypothetical protein
MRGNWSEQRPIIPIWVLFGGLTLLAILGILANWPISPGSVIAVPNASIGGPSMREAIFGLVGVLVGGIITSVSSYLLDRRRELVDRQRDSRNRAIELKRAARLIDAELSRAQAAARICTERGHWWSPEAQLSRKAWEQYGGVIAPDLSDTAWLAVRVAIEAADQLSLCRGQGTTDISDGIVEEIVPILRDIEAGRLALSPFAREVPPASG